MTGNGKIAHLPRAIRDELNRRMDDGQTGTELLPWLNELPEVKKLLAEQFAARPIVKQNLYQWHAGGHRLWLAGRETLAQALELAADAQELSRATGGKLTDHLATILSARYAAALAGWTGEVTDEFRGRLRLLHGLCQDIIGLRRADHSGARLSLEQQRLERERQKTEEEVFEQFQRWARNPTVRDCLCKNWTSPQKLNRRYREIFGRKPIPPEESARRDELRESPIHCPKPPNPDSQTPDPVTAGNSR